MFKVKDILLVLSLITISIFNVTAQNKLIIEIVGLKNSDGFIQLSLLDENKQEVRGVESKIENKKCMIVFENLKTQKYAIQCFHDENGNKKLDKNLIGIPKESFGFSNNAFGKFGPKKYKYWLFTIKKDTQVQIQMNNF